MLIDFGITNSSEQIAVAIEGCNLKLSRVSSGSCQFPWNHNNSILLKPEMGSHRLGHRRLVFADSVFAGFTGCKKFSQLNVYEVGGSPATWRP